jgi:L-2,4-diaminobutyrate transaminase
MKMTSAAELDRSHHLHPFTSVPGLLRDGATVIRRGNGVIVEDDRGRELIDAAAGLWCVNVGHGRREIVDAVAKQMNELAFFHTFNGMTNEPIAKLSARVLDCAPAGMRRVFFGNSGSDANDTAIKLVTLYNNLRKKEQKKKIIARWRGYHGVTIAQAASPDCQVCIDFSICRWRRCGMSTGPTDTTLRSARRPTMRAISRRPFFVRDPRRLRHLSLNR